MTAWADFRPLPLLKLLTAKGVDFVLIGGYAAVLHGSPRVTQDLDLCYWTDPANLRVLAACLLELRARLYGMEDDVPFVPDERTLAKVELLTLDTDLGKLDLRPAPPGAPPYKRLRERSVTYDVGGFLVRVASIRDLLAMKSATGRPKDIADVAELEAIERLRRATPPRSP